MIVDCHCHVIPAEMTTAAVPERWRPRLGRDEAGRQSVGLGDRVIRSIVGEFTDLDVMLGQAARQGVDHLLLSPWIMLVPADAGPAEARQVCEVQNAALSALAAARPAQVSVLGAVAVRVPAAADCLRDAMRLPGLRAWRSRPASGATTWASRGSSHSGRRPRRPAR